MNQTSRSNGPKLRELVRRMAEETPATKAGVVKWLWPAVKDALSSGHKLKAIWQRLSDQGELSDITYDEFGVYVRRIRQKENGGAAPPQGEKKPRAKLPAVQTSGNQLSPSGQRMKMQMGSQPKPEDLV